MMTVLVLLGGLLTNLILTAAVVTVLCGVVLWLERLLRPPALGGAVGPAQAAKQRTATGAVR